MSVPHLAPDLPVLDDPAVAADDVLGEGAIAALSAILESCGACVERAVPAQTTYYPGRSLTVRHEVVVRWADGTRTTESMVLSSGRKVPEGALVISDGTNDVVAWRLPHDPWLPGLAPALDPSRVRPLLAEVGLEAPELRCAFRAYRPGRRAVVEVTGAGVRSFLKVVTPRSVEALHRRHELLSGPVPVPQSLGWSAEHGIVVLQALAGRTLRQALLARFGLPGPNALLAVLEALPPVGVDDAPAVDWRAHEWASLVGSVAPELAEPTRTLADGLAPFESEAAAQPVVAVHGDFYEAQLLVDGGSVTGLLDVDTFGAGRRVADLAAMIGHLSVLAIGSPRRAVIERYATRLLDGFDRHVDPALLRAAISGVVLGLASGSFRVLEPNWRQHTQRRVDLAGQWLASAHKARVGRVAHVVPNLTHAG